MLALEDARAEEHLPPLKYHGKWCFARIYGAPQLQLLMSFYITLCSLDVCAIGVTDCTCSGCE